MTALWGLGVASGSVALWGHSSRPGRAADVGPRWPQATTLAPLRGRTLVVFAHPACPCTRATLGELARVLARVDGRLEARVVFYLPAKADPTWADGESLELARRTPGVTIVFDEDGALSRQFGAFTSGETLVFGRDGRLEFHGGLTSARGHDGESPGTDAVLALVNGAAPIATTTPVFGCSLAGR